MLMSDGYLHNGKTILCRATDKDRYTSLDDVNRNDVVVMVIAGRTRSSSHRSSRAREFHPHPLTEPCVKVSPHTALHTQLFVHRHNLGV